MVRMLVAPAPGTPEDARAVARSVLTDLSARLDHALDEPRALDPSTRAHFADARERIAQALTAPMIQTTTSTR